MAIDIKTGKPVEDGPKKHMTVTWQSVAVAAVLGLILGVVFAAFAGSQKKPYAMYAGLFAAAGALTAVLVQILDVKALKTKQLAPDVAAPTKDSKAA